MRNVKRWNAIYKQKGRTYITSLEHLNEILTLFQTYSVKKVLDLGCGSGGYIVSLAKNGFEVYGLDFSIEAIEVAKSWLKEDGYEGNLELASIYKELPYSDNIFDAVISFRVIHHAKIEDIRKLIKELERILKPQGLIFITVPKWRILRKKVGNLEMFDSRTFILKEVDQKDVVHYLFNKKLLKKEFKNFKINTLRINNGYYTKDNLTIMEQYYCLIGKKRL